MRWTAENRRMVVEFGLDETVVALLVLPKDGKPWLAGSRIIDKNVRENPDRVLVSLRRIVEEWDLRGVETVAVLPGAQQFMRFVQLPDVSDDRLKAIMRYEAEQTMPVPMDEIAWGYHVTNRDRLRFTTAIIAVKDSVLETCHTVIVSSGLAFSHGTVTSVCLANVMKTVSPVVSYGEELGIHMGENDTDLVFMEGGEAKFSRCIPLGLSGLVAAIAEALKVPHKDAREMLFGLKDETLDLLVHGFLAKMKAEITRSTRFYESQYGGKPPKVARFSGKLAVSPSFGEWKPRMADIPVELLDHQPCYDIDFSIPGAPRSYVPVSVAGVAAGLVGHEAMKLALVPRCVADGKRRIRTLWGRFAVVLMVLCPLFLGLNFLMTVSARNHQKTQLQQRTQSPRQQDITQAILAAVGETQFSRLPKTSFDHDARGLHEAVISGMVSDPVAAIECAKRVSGVWRGCGMKMDVRPSSSGYAFEITLWRL